MRRACWLVLVLGACGDNGGRPQIEARTELPEGGIADILFDRTDVPVVRTTAGVTLRREDNKWKAVGTGVKLVDFGSDNDGTLLAISGTRVVYQLDRGVLSELGATVAGPAGMPMQVPSGFRYVKELEAPHRTWVLTTGATEWIESPPMFFARPVRSYERTLYAAAQDGVQKFEANDARPFAVTCAQLGKSSCVDVLVGGADHGKLFVADDRAVFVVDGGAVERIDLPDDHEPVAIAAGKQQTLVLAKRGEVFALFLITAGGAVLALDTEEDPPSSATRLVVDRAGKVYAATLSLSTVEL